MLKLYLLDYIKRILLEELLFCSSVMNCSIFKPRQSWFYVHFLLVFSTNPQYCSIRQDSNERLQQVGTDQREMWLVSLDSGPTIWSEGSATWESGPEKLKKRICGRESICERKPPDRFLSAVILRKNIFM